MGPPIAGWFIMENPIETGWWLGVPLFLWKPPFQQSYRMLQAPYPNGGNLKHCIAVASMCLSASAMASSSRCLQPFLVWNHMNSMFLPWTHGQIMNQHGSDHQQSTSIDASTSSFLASRPLTFGPCHVKWWSADQPCCRRIKHDGRSASPGILWKWDSRPYWAILGHTSNSTYPSYNHTWSWIFMSWQTDAFLGWLHAKSKTTQQKPWLLSWVSTYLSIYHVVYPIKPPLGMILIAGFTMWGTKNSIPSHETLRRNSPPMGLSWWLIPRIVSGWTNPGYKWDKWGQGPLIRLISGVN